MRDMHDKRDFFQPLELRHNGKGILIFPKETVIALLVEVFGELKIDNKITKKIFESIGENLYQGGGQKPQLFYWLKSLRELLEQTQLDEKTRTELVVNFKNLIEELKRVK